MRAAEYACTSFKVQEYHGARMREQTRLLGFLCEHHYVSLRRGRNVASVREDVKLDVVFKEFMSSNNHMLLVRRAPDMPGAPDGEVVGLITLEDVMEELIQVCAAVYMMVWFYVYKV